MNPLLIDQNILSLLFSVGVVGGFIRISWRDLRFLVTHDRDIILTLVLIVLLVASSRSWHLIPDMLYGAFALGCIVWGFKFLFGKKLGTGDCLVYPLCGFIIGLDSLQVWLLWVGVLVIILTPCWTRYRGKRIWPLSRLRRIIFPGTPPAVLALFLTWGIEVMLWG